ncbi:hypothetical protein ACJ72_02721 [Emergomyces africanus]|uniref:Uncharacterized protein n=1 Tax=Emergomyces africanus TaxID=1955775 RepID=A0A1B7P1M2_9EURO|nr:hypothetical protein ACJ72_02721 [Emergomyces africanus]
MPMNRRELDSSMTARARNVTLVRSQATEVSIVAWNGQAGSASFSVENLLIGGRLCRVSNDHTNASGHDMWIHINTAPIVSNVNERNL